MKLFFVFAFLLFVCLFFSHSFHPNYSFPSLHLSQCPLQIYSFSISLQKRTDLPGILTKHGITFYSKIGHITSSQVLTWTRQLSWMIMIRITGKKTQGQFPPLLLGVLQEHQCTQPQHICRGSRSVPYRLLDCCFSLGRPL